jgi:hypothetical protein
MLVQFLRALWNLSRKLRRSRKFKIFRPSTSLRLFLQPLEARLIPAATATQTLTSGTLTIVEANSANPDIITETGVNTYNVVDSAKPLGQNFSGVNNISFYANTSNVSVEFFNNSSATNFVNGYVAVTGLGNFRALTVQFESDFNTRGKVTVTNSGIGSSMVMTADNDFFGALTVTGGSPVSGAQIFTAVDNNPFNGAVYGTYVDLEGTTVNSSTTINFGAGGGGFLTNYNLDQGNSSNDSVNGSTDQINGNLSVVDNASFVGTQNLMGLFNTNISGNVSIYVSAFDVNEAYFYDFVFEGGGVIINNVSVGKNLTVNTSVNVNYNESTVLVNSSVTGNVSLIQGGQAEEAYQYIYGTSINGSLSVTQANGYYSRFIADSPNLSIGGSVTVKQTAQISLIEVANFTSIKGAISITQSGVLDNVMVVENSLLESTITLTQGTVSANNELYLINVSIPKSTTINQEGGSNQAILVVENVSINGSLTINHVFAKNGNNIDDIIVNDSINGALTINSGGGVNNSQTVDSDTINGAVTITQSVTTAQEAAAAWGYDSVTISNTAVHGNVSINQPSGADNYAGIFANTSITGTLTIKQGAPNDDNVEINDSLVSKNVSISQGLANVDTVDFSANAFMNGSVLVTQNASAEDGFTVETATFNNGLTVTQYNSQNDSATFAAATIINNALITQTSTYNNSVGLTDSSVSGNVTINQSGKQYAYVLIENNSSIGGNLSIVQTGSLEALTELVDDVTFTKNVTITQGTGTVNALFLEFGVNIGGNLLVNMGVASTENFLDLLNSSVTGATNVNMGLGGTSGKNIVELGTYFSYYGYTYDYFPTTYQTTFKGTVTVDMGNGSNHVAMGYTAPVIFTSTATFAANKSGSNFAYIYNETETTRYNPILTNFNVTIE